MLQRIYKKVIPTAWASISSQANLSTEFAATTHFHSASNITSSTLALARIAGGTYNASTFLSGISSFAQPSFSSLAQMPVLGTAASTNVTLYASSTHNITSATHTFPGNTSTFLRADGTFSAPVASAAWGSISGDVSSQVDISTLYAITTHFHSASAVTSSTLALARIAGGTYNASTFLNGTSTFTQPVYAHLAGLPPTISTVKLSSIRLTATTSSLPITELAFTVSNTIAYSFEFGMLYASRISSNGLRLGLQYPAATAVATRVSIPTLVATGTDSVTEGYIIETGSSVVAPNTPLASTQYLALLYGSIVPAANGTLQFCYATETNAQTISSFVGSYGILTTL